MHALLFVFILFVACFTTSAEVPAEMSKSWWMFSEQTIENLRYDRCHSDLTDLTRQSLFPTSSSTLTADTLEKIFSLRMKINKKMSEWYAQDPLLSDECQTLAVAIQKNMEIREEEIASDIYKKSPGLPMEQKVFTDSQYQLRTNPWLEPALRVTSLNDLKNGDIVVQFGKDQEERYSLIYKMDDGKIYSLEQQLDFSWAKYDIHHSLSWVKRPLTKVLVLRATREEEAQQMVESVLQKMTLRKPSSALNFMSAFQKSPLLQGKYVRVMEWKNYQQLNPSFGSR